MIRSTITLIFFFYTISAQIALPTFQAVHTPNTSSSSSSSIFSDLKSLAISLNSLTSITNSNLGSVENTIEAKNSSFNVFAVVGKNGLSEQLAGTGAAGGKTTFSSPNFVYNTSSSNILSTGNTIESMTGGDNAVINGNKWMAMALYDGSTNGFKGILLWVFTDDMINSSNSITSDGHTVTTAKSIFYPANSGSNYNRIYAVAIDGAGSVAYSDYDGNVGWNFSNNQQPGSSTGYKSVSKFSRDDGFWGFKMNGGKCDGNSPGPSIFSANGFGIGNSNSSDGSSSCYWNGSNTSSSTYVGFVFTGDSETSSGDLP